MSLAFDWLAKRAELTPDNVALVDAATDREFTYREFNDRAGRLAGFMRDEWGLEPGDRAAIVHENRIEYVEMAIAIARAGGALVPLMGMLTDAEHAFMASDAEARR